MSTNDRKTKRKAAAQVLRGFRGLGVFLFFISGIINVLALTGSFYMLQVYDRALTSGSIPTLAAISVLAIGLYVFQGLFDILRSQILVRVGARMDMQLAPVAHQVTVDMPRLGYSTSEALERGRDVDTIRGFLGSQGPMALFDLPWMPLFLVFVYILHPLIGALTIAGAFVLTMIAIATELLTRRRSQVTFEAAVRRNATADSNARNAEVLKAMGFAGRAVARFTKLNQAHLELQTQTSDISGTLGAVSRVLRMLLQSAVLGLAAFLTIRGELSAGAIVATTIASARAMAPIDLAIANWKQVVAARTAWGRLCDAIEVMANRDEPMPLPAPCKSLKLEQVTVAAPGTGRVLLSMVSFSVEAGQAVGLIGPSGGGKTTLARALTGIWPVLRGKIRLDDADLTQWGEEALGAHFGYLPQDVALLDATVEENIARLEDPPDPRKVVEAARAAAVHEMIVRLPEGYKTELGPLGTSLSAGQRQRIGLARALYRDPFVVVLDEPNSNLDPEGEAALAQAIEGIKRRGGIAIVIAHRPSALRSVDLVGVIKDGKLAQFGPKDEVLAPAKAEAGPPPAKLPVAPAASKRPLAAAAHASVVGPMQIGKRAGDSR